MIWNFSVNDDLTEIIYGRLWFQGKKKLIDFYDIDIARNKHSSNALYVAVLGTTKSPRVVICLSGESINVSFLDESLNDVASCNYEVLANKSLVISTASIRSYDLGAASIVAGLSFSFNDLNLWVRREQFIPAHDLKLTNYPNTHERIACEYPKFGDYKVIIENCSATLSKLINEYG